MQRISIMCKSMQIMDFAHPNALLKLYFKLLQWFASTKSLVLCFVTTPQSLFQPSILIGIFSLFKIKIKARIKNQNYSSTCTLQNVALSNHMSRRLHYYTKDCSFTIDELLLEVPESESTSKKPNLQIVLKITNCKPKKSSFTLTSFDLLSVFLSIVMCALKCLLPDQEWMVD
eukprot:m.305952 g.305952  ORF g.305952 m.305952 type:complete len:173 (+) comp16452_c2_seq4:2183-2701(+)